MPEATILVAVSEAAARARFVVALSWEGYVTSSAPSGQKVLVQLGVVQPDVILLDLEIDNGDGWETLRRIRAMTTVPVIGLVSDFSSDVCVRALRGGADFCVPKPVSMRELRARVRALLRRARGHVMLVEPGPAA